MLASQGELFPHHELETLRAYCRRVQAIVLLTGPELSPGQCQLLRGELALVAVILERYQAWSSSGTWARTVPVTPAPARPMRPEIVLADARAIERTIAALGGRLTNGMRCGLLEQLRHVTSAAIAIETAVRTGAPWKARQQLPPIAPALPASLATPGRWRRRRVPSGARI